MRALSRYLILGAFLGALVFSSSPVLAASPSTNPIPGNGCLFQNPVIGGSNLQDRLWLDPRWPEYYQRDPDYPGLHFNTGQWAGLDVRAKLKLPFANGGIVIASTGTSRDPAGGGFGVVYEGLGPCTGWITSYWHNPTPVAYEIGQVLDANMPAGTPGCTGFEDKCGIDAIPPHSHWTIGFQSDGDPFPQDIPAFNTTSPNPILGSIWWVSGLRLFPDSRPAFAPPPTNTTTPKPVTQKPQTPTAASPLIGLLLITLIGVIVLLGVSREKRFRQFLTIIAATIVILGVLWLLASR